MVRFIPLKPGENGCPVAGVRPVVALAAPADSRATMPAADFCAWQIRMGWTVSETARQLGISRTTVTHYRLCGAPHHIGLAAAALVKGLTRGLVPQTTDA